MHRSPSRHKLLLAAPALLALACGSASGDSLFASSGGPPAAGAGGSSAGSSTVGGAAEDAGSAGDSAGGSLARGGSGGVDIPGNGGAAGQLQGGNAGKAASGGTGGSGGSGGITPTAGAAGAPRGGSGGAGVSGGGGGACAPAREMCDGLDNDCDAQIDEGACTSACSGFAIAGRGYMYCGTRLRAMLAEQNYCAVQGMHLAWIETAEENGALLAAVAEVAGPAPSSGSEPGVSIGGTDVASEGEWVWGPLGAAFWEGGPDGEPVGRAFANWSANRPNDDAALGGEDCAVLLLEEGVDGAAGEWNDVQCSNPHEFVCEQVE